MNWAFTTTEISSTAGASCFQQLELRWALLVRQGCCTVLSGAGPQPCPVWCGSAGKSQGWAHQQWLCSGLFHLRFPQCFPSTQLCRLCELTEKPSVIQKRTSLRFSTACKQQKKDRGGHVFLNASRCNTLQLQECVCAGQFCLYIESGCWLNLKKHFCKSHCSSPDLCTHLVAPSY